MKYLFSTIFAALAFCLCACGGSKTASENGAMEEDSVASVKKSLVVYFSASENKVTQAAAKRLAELVGADLFEIVPEQIYTAEDLDWHNKQSRSSVEMADSLARPAFKGKVENIADYEVVYIGAPIWWNTMPRVVNTFMEQTDLKGKVVMPFATSGGSPINQFAEDMKAALSESDVRAGLLINADCTDEAIKAWANQ